jgi:RNA polymerase sigma factor (sigma-70 family)
VAAQHEETHRAEPLRAGARSRERLVADYLPRIRAIAFRYRGFGLPIDDLVQEGSFGLLEAIDRYDAERGMDFDMYARFRIRRAIRNALTDQSRLIRLPKRVVERRRVIERAESAVKNATGRSATPIEIGEATGLPASAVIAARSVDATPISLDQIVLEDGSSLETLVIDSSACDPEVEVVEHEEVEEVDEAVAALPPRQREVVSRHFGLGRDAEAIAEVAADLHVSQQRARAIERDALSALRDRLEPVITPRPTRWAVGGTGRRSGLGQPSISPRPSTAEKPHPKPGIPAAGFRRRTDGEPPASGQARTEEVRGRTGNSTATEGA